MLPNVSEYHRPSDIAEALCLLRRRSVRTAPLAGGTSLLASPAAGIDALVDLSSLGLSYIRQENGSLCIGAMTTLQEVVMSPFLASYAGGMLARAAHESATRTVRNSATLGGRVMACGPATDVVVALLALEAQAVAAGGEIVELDDVLAGDVVARRLKLLIELRLPLSLGDWQAAFDRVATLPSDQAIVNLAALLHVDGDVCSDIRLAAGGLGPKPVRLHTAEGVLRGERLSDAAIAQAVAWQQEQLTPPSDVRGSSEYRRAMLSVLLRRAIQACLGKDGGQ